MGKSRCLLFGYAADRCTEPDWLVLPDGRQPNAWRLLHAARKGGDRPACSPQGG